MYFCSIFQQTYNKQRKKHFSLVICLSCIMSIFEIFLSQDDILQRSTGCNKKNSCHQPSLISQFRENVISFNFLANALAVHFKITNWKTCCRTVSYH